MRTVGKTVVLISSKGGSGKSTVAVGLATAFSLAGKKVLLIDADEGARCLDSMLSINGETVFDISDVLKGNCEVEDAVLNVPNLPQVSIIPSPMSGEALDLAALGDLTEKLKEIYDYVIVDTKGQLPVERLLGLPKSAEVISVVTTDEIAVRNTGILDSALIRAGFKPRLIINRFKRKAADGSAVNIDSIIDETNARLIGIVPEDKKIGAFASPLVFGIAAKAVFRIAGRIDNRIIPLPKLKEIL